MRRVVHRQDVIRLPAFHRGDSQEKVVNWCRRFPIHHLSTKVWGKERKKQKTNLHNKTSRITVGNQRVSLKARWFFSCLFVYFFNVQRLFNQTFHSIIFLFLFVHLIFKVWLAKGKTKVNQLLDLKIRDTATWMLHHQIWSSSWWIIDLFPNKTNINKRESNSSTGRLIVNVRLLLV